MSALMRANKNKRQRSKGPLAAFALSHLSLGPWTKILLICAAKRMMEDRVITPWLIASAPRQLGPEPIWSYPKLGRALFYDHLSGKGDDCPLPFGGTLFPTNPAIHRCFENVKFKATPATPSRLSMDSGRTRIEEPHPTFRRNHK